MNPFLKKDFLGTSNEKNKVIDPFKKKFESMVDAQFNIHCKLIDGYIFRARVEGQSKPKKQKTNATNNMMSESSHIVQSVESELKEVLQNFNNLIRQLVVSAFEEGMEISHQQSILDHSDLSNKSSFFNLSKPKFSSTLNTPPKVERIKSFSDVDDDDDVIFIEDEDIIEATFQVSNENDRDRILKSILRGGKDLFVRSVISNDVELVHMIHEAHYDYSGKYKIDKDDFSSLVEDKKITENLFDSYLDKVDAYWPKSFKVMRINEVNEYIKANNDNEIKEVLGNDNFDIIAVPVPSKSCMSLLVFERKTNNVAVINPSKIPNEELTKIIKDMGKEWSTIEIDTPCLSNEKEIPFAILDLIKVAYRNFFVVKHENKKATLDDYEKTIGRKDYNALEERENVALFLFHYWSLAKKVVKKPENKERSKENKNDFKKIVEKKSQKEERSKENKSYFKKIVEKKSQKEDAKIENKINFEEEKDEASKDKDVDVFKSPKDFQVPATTKNKEEIDETTILK